MTRLKIYFFLFMLMTGIVFADTPSQQLNQHLTNIRSMQANFTQNIMDNHGKILQTAQGKMMLQRPGQFRWQTLSPVSQLVVTNGLRLWIYDPDLEQVVVRSLVKQTGETPALLLSDANPALDKDYQVKIMSSSMPNKQLFLLIPKDKSSMMQSIQMTFVGNELQQMKLHDHLGHTTMIEFKNIESNLPIKSSLFKFIPPKNVDVIDETK